MIRQLLLTDPGERVDLPQFGCGLRSLVFAPNSDALAATVKLRVIQGLQPVAGRHRERGRRRDGATGGPPWSPGTLAGDGHLHAGRDPDQPDRDGDGRMSPDQPTRDRRQLLLAPGAVLNGIDYVDVGPQSDPALRPLPEHRGRRGSLSGSRPVTITGGEIVTGIAVDPIDETTAWSADSQGRPVLALTVTAPGDFSTYRLTISSTKLDPFFGQAPFTFRAGGPAATDCAAPAPGCPEPAQEPVPIDYLAKDFASFRQALSEFSAQRYPAWVERSEADLGVMLMEVLAAMADELSYYQDRVLAESTLATATQRLSVVRHARLVDYEPTPAIAATAVLQLDVSGPRPARRRRRAGRSIRAHRCWSVPWERTEQPSTSRSRTRRRASRAPSAPPAPAWANVDTRWNRASLRPYYWDDSQRCLPASSTDIYLTGHGLGLYSGQQLLLDTHAADIADAPVRELVTVSDTEEISDPLIGYPPPTLLTHVFLPAPTTEDHDLASTEVAGNIVPAVQGLRLSETFVIPDPAAPPGPVVVRAGANSTPQDPRPDYRYCLASGPLAWLATTRHDASSPALPEIVTQRDPGRRQHLTVDVPALAARCRASRPGVHADARAVLAGAHEQRHYLA